MPNAKTLWDSYRAGRKAGRARLARPFSGRNDFRLAYFRLIESAIEEKFENYYVVNFYGAPGIGKSALLRRLELELMGEDSALPDDASGEGCLAAKQRIRALCEEKKPVVLRADFDDPGLASVQEVLLAFRTQLIRQTDTVFPFFDLAMELLYQKQGRYLKNVEKEKKSLTDDPVLGFLWDTVSDATPVGTIVGAAKALTGLGGKVQTLLRDRKEAFQATYNEIRDLDVPELLRRLPLYFAMDVNASAPPLICVFLDTYEMAYSRGEGAGYQAGLDEGWLTGPYGLVRYLGNAVFAVAGRERLNVEGEEWSPLCLGEEDYSRLLSQRLEPLSPEETKDYLKGCGLTETLANELYHLTGGDPVYLELCLDQYESMRATGREPRSKADFGGSRQRLVERHTRYLPAHLREPLSLLAALERWDDAQYAALRQELPLPLPVAESADYLRLTSLSYVRREKAAWSIHPTIAPALASMLTSGMRGMLVQALAGLGNRARQTFALERAAQWYAYGAAQLEACPECLPPETALEFWEQWAQLCEETGRRLERITARQRLRELRDGDPWAACQLGRAYFDAQQYQNALSPLRESVLGFAKQDGHAAPRTLLAAGLYHAVCQELEREDTDPLTAGIGWDYPWTGRETAEDLVALCEWWRLRVNYSAYGYYEENHEFLQRLAAALKAGPDTVRCTPAALWAEAQLTQQFAEQQCDSELILRHELEASMTDLSPLCETYEDRERQWERTPKLREPEVVLQTCAELVEHHKRVLAADDPRIANALGTLAFAQESQGLFHLAVGSRQEALGLLRKAYGDSDVDVLRQEAILIADYRKAGRFADAIRQQQTRMDRLCGDGDEPAGEDWYSEAKGMATLWQRRLRGENDASGRQECLSHLIELWEAYAPTLKRPSEHDILPWGRGAVWCLTHPECDVEGVTEEFVTQVVKQCRTKQGERPLRTILQSAAGGTGWRGQLAQ